MPTCGNRFAAVVVAAACVLFPGKPGQTATRIVDKQSDTAYPTIQSAIDAAIPGDVVLVRCGTYRENVVMRSGVDLQGSGASCTVIDGMQQGNVVQLPTVDVPTAIAGFTLRNGQQQAGASGAGIESLGGQPVITRNVIENNGVGGSGAGIVFRGFSEQLDAPIITRNVIRGNVGCCAGGGIALQYSEGGLVATNLIVGNSAYYGAGIYSYGGNVTFAGNTVAYNDGWIGGGVSINSLDALLVNNVIVGNTAVIYAGGVWGDAGGNVVANNVYVNSPEDWFFNDPTGVDGNIAEPPDFTDATRYTFAGFQPRSSSALIDAGAERLDGDTDLRGVTRPLDGDADGVALPDIGARENEGVTGVRFVASATASGPQLIWDETRNDPDLFNVYRGSVVGLRETGVYTQDPGSSGDSRHFCAVSNGLNDRELPGVEPWFYLVTSVANAESGLGFDGTLTERQRSMPCTP